MKEGVYTSARASALSGVPLRTIHRWASEEVLIPSVSAQRTKLWSFSDLLGLRTVQWLRQPKQAPDGARVPGTQLSVVKKALHKLKALDVELFDEGQPMVAVTRDGDVVVRSRSGELERVSGQLLLADILDVLAPFESGLGARGPDLMRPGEFLRISPRRLAGAPHVLETRVETEALYTLSARGFTPEQLGGLYPTLRLEEIADALRLERQLAHNLSLAA